MSGADTGAADGGVAEGGAVAGGVSEGVWRCADWSRAEAVDPIGTAGIHAGYLLVEWPLPWPRDLGDIPELQPVRDALAGTRIRMQGLVATSADARQIVLYRRPEAGAFAGFHRSERAVPLRPVLGDNGVGRPNDPVRAGLALGAAAAELITAPRPASDPGRAVTDVLVCTHGRRDRCCGGRGMDLWRDLSSPGAIDTGDTGGGTGGGTGGRSQARLWRTSHTGGHRFAPTAIVLPEGTVWAYLDQPALERILAREGPVEDLLPRYRGCAGLTSTALQALERAVFGQLGWSLLSSGRSGEELADGRVRLTVSDPDPPTPATDAGRPPAARAVATPSVWEASVGPGRTMPVPDCGGPVDQARKTQTELRLSDLTRVG